MKKAIPILLSLSLLASCSSPTAPIPTCAELAQAVAEGQGYTDLPALDEETVEACLTDLYGLTEDSWEDAAILAADGVDARELAVIRLTQGEDVRKVELAFRDYRISRDSDFFGYAPAQSDLVSRSRSVSWEVGGQSYVGLFICQDPSLAEQTLFSYLRETAPTVETSASCEGTAPFSPPDTEDFLPYTPPNQYDMTLYDTIPILAAYASGDVSALSSKDAAILEVASKVLEETVTETMTDFEKELALHDWLIDWGHYDETIQDRATPMGREDNNNPYGMLVGRYGNCLGYAATFQLLMELAGVECITVVGATHNSTADHAWNMVKLEGEWYCVDPAWNDPVPEDISYLSSEAMRHPYFNVTSQFMYDTHHQWDYEAVPWTTATRFFWDGTTWELPQ